MSYRALLAVLSLPTALAAQTPATWAPDFAPSGTSAEVRCLTLWDDGSGEVLLAGGSFGATSDAVAIGVARWNGTSWLPLGEGLDLAANETVVALEQGAAGSLLAAIGSFQAVGGLSCNGVALWDGLGWSPLGDGPPSTPDEILELRAGTFFDTGSGPELWVAGSTRDANFEVGGSRAYLARWDGQTWTRVLDGPASIACDDVHVLCEYDVLSVLEVFDDGSGPKLYAGGLFGQIGGQPASTLAVYDGITWAQAPATGPGGASGEIRVATVHDDGSGARLVLGGVFASGPDTSLIAHDGSAVHALGAGPGLTPIAMGSLSAAAGQASGLWLVPQRPLVTTFVLEAKHWDGSAWSAVDLPMNYPVDVFSVAALQGELYLGGRFPTPAPGVASANIARYDGVQWKSLSAGGSGLGTLFSSDSNVAASVVHDDGNGPALYVAGEIATSGASALTNVVRWTGAGWDPIPGFSLPYLSQVEDMVSIDLGQGPELWMAGDLKVGNSNPGAFARWHGGVLTGFATSSEGVALAVFDDGGGPDLYLATTSGLSRYDGATFTSLGSGTIEDLEVHDDGSGAKLYVGGAFTSFPSVGGAPANNVARFDGTTWEGLGDGLLGPGGNPFAGRVLTLDSVEDSTGNRLVAGGQFTQSGATALNGLAGWDGTTWNDIGGGVGGSGARVLTACAFDDGRGGGPALYVGGSFSSAGGLPAQGLARWNGTTWSTEGLTVQGSTPTVRELHRIGAPIVPRRALLAGGDFDGIDGTPAQRLTWLLSAKRAPVRQDQRGPAAQSRPAGQ